MAYLALISGIVKGAGQIVQGVTSEQTASITEAGQEQVAQTNAAAATTVAQDQLATASLNARSGGSSNTTLFVIGGIVLAGIVVTIILINKAKTPVIVQQT